MMIQKTLIFILVITLDKVLLYTIAEDINQEFYDTFYEKYKAVSESFENKAIIPSESIRDALEFYAYINFKMEQLSKKLNDSKNFFNLSYVKEKTLNFLHIFIDFMISELQSTSIKEKYTRENGGILILERCLALSIRLVKIIFGCDEVHSLNYNNETFAIMINSCLEALKELVDKLEVGKINTNHLYGYTFISKRVLESLEVLRITGSIKKSENHSNLDNDISEKINICNDFIKKRDDAKNTIDFKEKLIIDKQKYIYWMLGTIGILFVLIASIIYFKYISVNLKRLRMFERHA